MLAIARLDFASVVQRICLGLLRPRAGGSARRGDQRRATANAFRCWRVNELVPHLLMKRMSTTTEHEEDV
jgi:hypothetical protein